MQKMVNKSTALQRLVIMTINHKFLTKFSCCYHFTILCSSMIPLCHPQDKETEQLIFQYSIQVKSNNHLLQENHKNLTNIDKRLHGDLSLKLHSLQVEWQGSR